MIVKVQRIGNSKGIILPKSVMEICSIHEEVSISVEDNHIIISAPTRPREGWDVQFTNAQKAGELEKDFSEGMANEFDKEEWTW